MAGLLRRCRSIAQRCSAFVAGNDGGGRTRSLNSASAGRRRRGLARISAGGGRFRRVSLAYCSFAFASSWRPMLPEAKRLSSTAATVSQFNPATRQGISTPSSRRLCMTGRITSMVEPDSSARAATVSAYFRSFANASSAGSLSLPCLASAATKRRAAAKSRVRDISRLAPAAASAIALLISSNRCGGARDNSRVRTASVALRSNCWRCSAGRSTRMPVSTARSGSLSACFSTMA